MSMLLMTVLVTIPLTISLLIGMLQSGASDFSEIVDSVVLIIVVCFVLTIPMLILSAYLVHLRGRWSGRKWIITSKLNRFWAQVVGFRQYVQLAGKGKLKFRTSHLKSVSSNDMLPYSVALGFVKDWREIVT